MKIQDFLMERFFAKYEFKAPYLLSSSDCEYFTVGEILEGANANSLLTDLSLGYTEPPGSPVLREEIAHLYELRNADEMNVTAGAQEAIFCFMNVALHPGDHVIYMSPAYQSLFEVARSIGCQLTGWELCEEEDWEPSFEKLKAAIRPATRAIILNNPHNPTGYLMPKEMLQQVIELCRQHDLYLFSDEVYRLLEYDASDRLPAVADLYEKGISLGVMSKAFGLAGLRIGWIVTPDQKLLKEFGAFKDYTSICNSAPSEVLATLALQQKDKLLERNLGIIRSNLALLEPFFQRYQEILDWKMPRAGSIAFPRLKVKENVEEFCIRLVDEKGVLLLPGQYYQGDLDHFRIGFGRKNMPQALALFDEYLQERYL